MDGFGLGGGILINTQSMKSCNQERNVEPKLKLSFVVKNVQQHTSVLINTTATFKLSWAHLVAFYQISRAKCGLSLSYDVLYS